MASNQDTQNLIETYEKMYGVNTIQQVNEALKAEETKTTKTTKKKRTRRGSRGSGKTKNLQEKNTSNKDDTKTIVKENNNIMAKSKFDEMFSKVYNEQFEDAGEMDIELGDPDVEGGDLEKDLGEGTDEVTITIPREMADKLCEMIMAAVDTGEGEDLKGELGGDEFAEDDFGGEDEGLEEGAAEDSLSTAPDGVKKFTSKNFKVGAKEEIGNQTHAGNRGASSAPGRVTPKPHAPQGK